MGEVLFEVKPYIRTALEQELVAAQKPQAAFLALNWSISSYNQDSEIQEMDI